MPLLLAPRPTLPTPVVAPVAAPQPTRIVTYRWTAPDTTVLPLTMPGVADGVRVLAGGDGLGATGRAITTQALATGGAMARWSHAEPRSIALPLRLQAATFDGLLALRRQVVRAFTQTTPPAGAPRPGVLRITRNDGTWREISALYVDGLSWSNDLVAGPTIDRAVLQLLCPDPWWYGPTTVALDFADTTTTRNYLNPYETVATGRTLGTVTVDVDGEIPVDPVWTITGPADTVTIRTATGAGLTYGTIAAGRTITIDVAAGTITDDTGTNRIGGIAWPSSTLFQLQPGDNDLVLSIIGGSPGVSGIRLAFKPRFESA